MKAAADGPMKGILAYTEDQVSHPRSAGLAVIGARLIFPVAAALLGLRWGHSCSGGGKLRVLE